jgi:exonuclease SbcD
MRVLHTSDWHLGRTFHGASLLDEQAEAIDRIVALAQEHAVELVVVAGDLFDRAIPPAPAVALLDDALERLHATGARVVAISGNHDSDVRVGVHDRLLNRAGVAVRGQVSRVDEPITIADPADGGPPVAVYLVPYLEPAMAAHALADPGDAGGLDEQEREPEPRARTTHDQVARLAASRISRHLGASGPARSIVVAHAFVAGGKPSESERELCVGDAGRVAVDVFDGFDLVALGHLHRPQVLGTDRLAYSGSPLAYSFSEEGQAKSVRIVELAPDGRVEAETAVLGVGRELRTVTGTLRELLEDRRFDDAVATRLRAVITDPGLPTQAMARIRERFPHAVELRHRPEVDVAARAGARTSVATLEELSPLALTLRFWEDQEGVEPSTAERALLARALTMGSRERAR